MLYRVSHNTSCDNLTQKKASSCSKKYSEQNKPVFILSKDYCYCVIVVIVYATEGSGYYLTSSPVENRKARNKSL